ncbi:MAG: Uma2 family endonuclease [Isosphaeraceae bacterium]
MSHGTLTETPPATSPQRKRWTIAEFDGLHRDGYLNEGSRTYLWDGEIVEPMTVNPPHVHAVANLVDLLKERLPRDRWTVNQDAPVVLKEGYKPQPDIIVLAGPRSSHRSKTPAPVDVVLLIEVSDSSLPKDAGGHLRAYAEAGIYEYWVVDINGRRVDAHTMPTRGEDGVALFAKRESYGLDRAVPLSLMRDGVAEGFPAVPVAAILQDSMEPEATP